MTAYRALLVCALVIAATMAPMASVAADDEHADPAVDPALLLNPKAPQLNLQAPDLYRVRLDTTRGDIVIEVHRAWSPRGADRFYNLVRGGYFDDSKFFRVRPGSWAQFGVSGDPRIANAWRGAEIPDEPRKTSNVRGTIAYAFAPGQHRATQVFINLRDNSATHDPEPFVPFGQVVEGIEAADALYSEYGDEAGGGIRGGRQDRLFEEGNEWLEHEFPKLDSIRRATLVAP